MSSDRQNDLSNILREGAVIAGKYRVESLLGQGGMGAVVAATHRRLGQRVAIKILHPSAAANPEAVARFLREAQSAAALQSEHVVRILDFGHHTDELPFMVMEYLRGTNLAELLDARGPLPVDEALQYVMQGSEAVAEAHARGIIHRDIKPANLFLTSRSDGSPLVKVLDFGISKTPGLAGEFNPDLTATTDRLGTPMYMSPEQVRGTKNVTPAADIWALGVMLYELLAGVPPFWADSLPALSARIVADKPAPLSQRRSDLPDGLEAAILWCLEKEPARRPQSVMPFARVFSRFAPTATHGWEQRIAHVVQQASVPNPSAEGPSLSVARAEVPQAWGSTHALRRSIRGGLLGMGIGGLAALVAGGVWWWVERSPSQAQKEPPWVAGSVSAVISAPVVASDAELVEDAGDAGLVGDRLDAGNEGATPAIVSAGAAASSASPPRSTGALRSDPLGDRY